MDTSSPVIASRSSAEKSALGQRVRNARKALGLTQQDLAEPRFTKAYVSAIERGAVNPSLKALDYLAGRLGLPASELLSARPEGQPQQLELLAVEEDLTYQINYAKMLIRDNKIDEGLAVVAEAEQSARPYWDKLPGRVRYLIPFTRGRAYAQVADPVRARPFLEEALTLADDDEAMARVRNLLGAVFYQQEQPQLALEQHLQCLHVARSALKDINLRLSIYHNLASDYSALNQVSDAIGLYKEALVLLEDLNDLQSQAGIYWGLAIAYRTENDWAMSKLYATRALAIYEAADNRSEAASLCISVAEILVAEQRYAEAGPMLDRAEDLVRGTGDDLRLSYLYRNRADLALRLGDPQTAAEHARRSLELVEGERERERAGTAGTQAWADAITLHAEAVQALALVEEALGHAQAADKLFLQAIELADQTNIVQTKYTINLSYAEVLNKRGAHERAVHYYRAAALSPMRGRRTEV